MRRQLLIGLVAAAMSTASAQQTRTCECGKNPPDPPRDRVVKPYAGEPTDLSPYEKFAQPYDLNYVKRNIYVGAGRDIPEPKDLTEVRIGFFAPAEHSPEKLFGVRMLHGVELALEEVNARGGYGGKPFKLMIHNDYDNWQAMTVSGADRPTDAAIWGSASDETVKMVYDDQDWAIFGSISSESTHIALRVALKAEIPIVNSASTDPTIPETYIPWYFTVLQDDRVQGLTLARHIYTELGFKRVALLRVNSRYGRFGVIKFRDASRRLGHPVVIEQKFLPGDSDFTRSLKIIQSSRADAIVLWADEIPAANILKQMKALGMKQRVFGAYRALGPELLAEAGPAAEGFEAVFPYDPTRKDAKWLEFNQRFESRFQEKPEQFASLAYDAMNALLESICRAGLNRARIHDALADVEEYDGVTGHMVFDPNQKNVEHMFLGTVHDGAITYKPATMEKVHPVDESRPSEAGQQRPDQMPYARVGEDGVEYNGPRRLGTGLAGVKIIVFGKQARAVVESEEMRKALPAGNRCQLLPVASNQNWGAASTELVRDLYDEHALAIVALDRDAAHLAEQLALKALVPVIAISDDKRLTSTNVPWIFRLPGSATPVEAVRLIRSASGEGVLSADRLREVLASGREIEGVAFVTTGEPK
ncbi:ABC transporter substrate-binding protein [Occallatibacter savannae]|uniref:ABC transporter substrate-binding protein n=1 Tax=Occallatibacter savannae TaxID=1002691 RepID=UPI000D69E821|nr:ABC transporter substrate-binding protein [Occallatibacter savannae]